jgi:hypothetical protein
MEQFLHVRFVPRYFIEQIFIPTPKLKITEVTSVKNFFLSPAESLKIC